MTAGNRSNYGPIVGLLLVSISIWQLFRNEHRAVHRYDALTEGMEKTVVISSPYDDLDPSNNGKLVHFAARIHGQEKQNDSSIVNNSNSSNDNNTAISSVLVDHLFGFTCTVSDCIALKRNVEMYQWTSNGNDMSGNKTYTKKWAEGHQLRGGRNKGLSLRFLSQTFVTKPVMAGTTFQLPDNVVTWLISKNQETIDVTTQTTGLSARQAARREEARIVEGKFYYDKNNETRGRFGRFPVLGDQRVWFTERRPETITIVGLQGENGTIKSVSYPRGSDILYSNVTAGDILLYERGNLTLEEIYNVAKSDNAKVTWGIRGAMVLLLFGGLVLIFSSPVSDKLPYKEHCGTCCLSVQTAIILSGLTIAIAWLIIRPIAGLIVVGVCLALIAFGAVVFRLIRRMQQQRKDDSSENTDNASPVVNEASFVPANATDAKNNLANPPIAVTVAHPVDDDDVVTAAALSPTRNLDYSMERTC